MLEIKFTRCTFVPTSEQTDKRTMGAALTMEHRTIAEICRTTGKDIDALRRAWDRKIKPYSGVNFSREIIPTSEQYAVLMTDNRTVRKAEPPVNSAAQVWKVTDKTPEQKPEIHTEQSGENPDNAPGAKPSKRVDFGKTAFRVMFGFGVCAHAFLVLWDASYLWGPGGLIAGLAVFLVISGSVVLMWSNRDDKDSENLLWFVWFLEICSGFAHKSALYHSGTNAFAAGISEFGTGCMAAIVVLCAMAMSYFYFKSSKA